MTALVEIENLSIALPNNADRHLAVEQVSLDVADNGRGFDTERLDAPAHAGVSATDIENDDPQP